MPKIRIHANAEEELERAFEWYEKERSGLGHDFLSAIGNALKLLGTEPVPSVPSVCSDAQRL
jgi:hypothetical protein